MEARILIVEDSAAQRFLLSKILKEHGFEVTEAENGQKALQILNEFSPDLIISDIMMPEMDGPTLCRTLKEDSSRSDTPIVLMTALSEPTEIFKIIESKADYLFLKEFEPEAFVIFVEDILHAQDNHMTQTTDGAVPVSFLKRIFPVTGDKKQLARLLISTYRSALHAYDRYYRLKHEIKQLENAHQQQLKAKDEKNRYRYMQISLLSEEIRTPLNNLFQIFELLQEAQIKQEHEVYLHLAALNTQQIAKSLDDLQTIAHFKNTTEQIPPQIMEFNLRECLDDALSPFGVQAGTKHIELIFHLPPGIPPFVKGEPNYLRHIIFILTDNACRFTEKGSVSLKVQKEQKDEDDFTLKFIVQDTGPGLSTQKQKELRQLFREQNNLPAKTLRKLSEANPGLFVAARLVHSLQGTIDFESSNSGSTFYFSLPMAPAAAPPEIISVGRKTSLEKTSVLILAEEWLNGIVLEELLAGWGAEVKVVNKAAQVLPSLQQAMHSKHPYHLFIMDSSARSASPFELLKTLQKQNELRSLKKILLTSFGQRGDALRCIDYGVSAFLLKPVKAKELYQTIQTVLQTDFGSDLLITRHSLKEAARPLRVLVAEDNRVNQKLMTALLGKEGYEIALATNGLEAVNLYKQKPFDLILMDMQMPIMDGFQATREIRQLEKETDRHVLIFALTASEDPKEIQGAYTAGVDEVLRKPLNLPALKDILKKYLQDAQKIAVEL